MGLFLEDKAGQQGYNLRRLIFSEKIVENQLRQYQFVCCINLKKVDGEEGGDQSLPIRNHF